ncbi:MAG: Ig-like domain-containing protein, partial [Patescibacteria group bacterium]
MNVLRVGVLCLTTVFLGCGGERFVGFHPSEGITPDTECPSVSVDPPSGAQNVSISETIRIEFSEPMKRETIGTANLYLRAGANVVLSSLETSGDTLAFLHPLTDLEPDTEYWIVVKKAVEDRAGNVLCHALNSSFRTRPLPDDDCPSVTSFYPPNGATGVLLETEIIANLDELIDELTVTSQTFYVLEDGNKVPGSISIQNGLTLRLRPTNLLRPNKTYTAVVTNVKDLAGNLLCEARVWSFTTSEAPDTECPRV